MKFKAIGLLVASLTGKKARFKPGLCFIGDFTLSTFGKAIELIDWSGDEERVLVQTSWDVESVTAFVSNQ